MASKLLLVAEKRWRRINAPHLVVLVKAGVEFLDGKAEMLQLELLEEDVFTKSTSVFAAEEMLIHIISQQPQPDIQSSC